MAAQQPFYPVVADVFSGGGGGGGPSTHSEGISSGKRLAVEMHLGSPHLNPEGRGSLKFAFHSVTCHFFFLNQVSTTGTC